MKYTVENIHKTMEQLVAENEMAGAALIVRKNGEEIFRGKWGMADIENQIPVEYNTIYRLASMSKPITAAATMQLWEQGKLELTDQISKYLPSYTGKPAGTVTIQDLLSHSCGLGMEETSNRFCGEHLSSEDRLADRVEKWQDMPLDFEPGTKTGYSGLVAFDILGRIVEVISGLEYQEYLKENLWGPLGTDDMGFVLTDEQLSRLAKLYNTEDGKQIYLATDGLWDAVNPLTAGYYSGAAGMFGTVEGYDKFVSMLANEGEWNGNRVLKKETVQKMHQRGARNVLETCPGAYWGLGMQIFADPVAMGVDVAPNTYGWSGAYGTHMFIHMESGISATFVMNRGNIGGASSYIARKVEELVFNTFLS